MARFNRFNDENFDISYKFDDSLEFDDVENDENAFNPTMKSLSTFVPIDDNDDDETENCFNDNNAGFKLPPRLAARLFKNKQTSQNEPKVLQNLENVKQIEKVPMIRRETIIVRSKKAKPFTNVNETLPINQLKQDIKNQTILIDNESEELRYVTWINSVIATSFKIENTNVDVNRIINDCILYESSHFKNSTCNNNAHLPLKDGISSLAYKEIKLMDILRAKATKFYESDRLKLVKEVLLEDLNVGRFYIRKDKSIHADVGAKKYILEIFLNYNPLWLKIALETVFGQKIEKARKNEVHTLVQFLTQRLLSFKELALKKNCKNVTTYFLVENNVKAAKQHILYNFLLIVNFLDCAKRARLIDHDPCLFRTDAIYKSSRDIIVAFSREFITGVGDIIKSLRNVGITLEYAQNPIEEFNFTVTRLSIDLRCGVRLARLAEILLLRNDILTKLYFPPNTITRKIHNMELVFKVLEPMIGNVSKTAAPRDICNGYRQKTITFLDKLIEVYNVRMREIELQQSIDSIIKIQRTFRRYLEWRAQRKYFLKLKAASIFIQRRFRFMRESLKLRRQFLEIREASIVVQRRFRANQKMKLDRSRYLYVYSKIVFIQQHFKSMCVARKVHQQYQNLKKSTIFVQRRFRQNRHFQHDRQQYLQLKMSAIFIQQSYRACKQRKMFLKLRQTVIFVQNQFRANQMAMLERQNFLKLKNATVFIQRKFHQNKLYKRDHKNYLQMRQSAIIIQRFYRTRLQHKSFIELRQAVVFVQKKFLNNRLASNVRKDYLQMRNATICLQRKFRQNQIYKFERQRYIQMLQSAIIVQRYYRTRLQRKSFLQLRKATLVIQDKFRSNRLARIEWENYLKLKSLTIYIQQRFRQNKLFKQDRQYYLQLKSSAVVIQRQYRTKLQQNYYRELKKAVMTIQAKFRANRLARIERQNFLKTKQVAIFIQKSFRQNCLYKHDRQLYLKMRKSAVIIQRYYQTRLERKSFLKLREVTLKVQSKFRANRLARIERERYLKTKQTAIFLQQRFRQNQQFTKDRQLYLRMKKSAVIIQRVYHTRLQRKYFTELRKMVIIIQQKFRANLLARIEREQFLKKRNASIIIQKHVRRYQEQLRYKAIVNAALTIQVRYRALLSMRQYREDYLKMKKAAMIIQIKYRATVDARQQRDRFILLKHWTIWIQQNYRQKKRSNAFKGVVTQYLNLVNNSAVTIQRFWRGYQTRKLMFEKQPILTMINQNLETISQSITEDKLMINVIYQIIERMFHVYSVNQLHKDIEKLEFATNVSERICHLVVQNEQIIQILIYSFNNLNRSEPHKKMIYLILGIFLNLFTKTNSKFLYCEDMLEIVFKTLRNFPKSNLILTKVLEILVYLLKDRQIFKLYKADKHNVLTLEKFIQKNLPTSYSGPKRSNFNRQNSFAVLSMKSMIKLHNQTETLSIEIHKLISR